MPFRQPLRRYPGAASSTMLALACLMTVGGCGGPSHDRFVPAPGDAQAALTQALDAWKAGVVPGPVPETTPQIHVTDSFRRPGETLHGYRILGETPGDAPRCYAVELEFSPARTEKARFVIVGIDPLWVFRLEDYQLLAHWEHRMEDTQPAPADQGAGATQVPRGVAPSPAAQGDARDE